MMTMKFIKATRTIGILVVLLWFVRISADAQTRPYNIILLTPDQLRADSVHTYGYDLPDTPNIDELARQGTLFLHAYSSGTWTTPSFGALFTGLFPTVHGMTLPPFLGCGPSITRPMLTGGLPNVPSFVNLSLLKPTMPEILKAHGMVTAADNANCWSFFDLVHRGWDSFKFYSGFQLVMPGHPDTADPFYNTAPETLSWATQWLTDHKTEPFFLWIHFMEPHSPYNPPREYDRFQTPEDFPDLYEDTSEGVAKLHSLAELGNAHAIRREEQLYAAKILYVDYYVGKLLKVIRDLKLDDSTIIVFTSDHGELLFSHPEDYNTTDHISLYDTDAHIPLIFRGPGISKGQRAEAIVSHYDLLSTILDLESVPPLRHSSGASLKNILAGNPREQIHDYVYGEQTDLETQFAIRDTRYKLIETLRTSKLQCFDLLSDPGEKHSICGDIPDIASKLKAALDLHVQSLVQEAKSYSDWEDNLALAVLEQRDSRGLRLLAPADQIFGPGSGNSCFQLNGAGLWQVSADTEHCEKARCYWTPAGYGNASATWRSEVPLSALYEVYYKYGGTAHTSRMLARNANIVVSFRGGSRGIPIDQNQNQGNWLLLGRFDHPISVSLTNLADGPVVAGSVRFLRVNQN